jgi:YfiH family protein
MNNLTHSMEQIAGFRNDWMQKEVNGLPLLFSPLLSQFSQLTHAFTTRLGGQSPKPMDSFNLGLHLFEEPWIADARANRSRLCTALSLESARLIVPNQPHSIDVLFTRQTIQTKADLEFDGITTDVINLPVLLNFADCVPIIIFDPVKNIFSGVHAGWRGTAGGIVGQAVKQLVERCQSRLSDLVAAVGPAIGSCCYPVSDEVVVALMQSVGCAAGPGASLKKRIDEIRAASLTELFVFKEDQISPDLKGINSLQLWQAGVNNVDVSNLCTACNPELFYSYRQSGGETGRQGLIAALTA